MVKRTIYFGNPAYLSLKLDQLVIKLPSPEPQISKDSFTYKTIPIEDIGMIVLDNPQITITQALIESLLNNTCAILSCDSSHLPVGMMLHLCGNTIQNERFRHQLEASLPLRKQLWQQTIQAKIHNQYKTLFYSTGEHHKNMEIMSNSVRSGDSENVEAKAAAYYWKNIFPDIPSFNRGQYDDLENSMLNYGYAILRAIISRALVISGLLPTLGIHHHNRYNAYCLADDIMEPYRPYIDRYVIDILNDSSLDKANGLTKELKAKLLSIPVIDVQINDHRSPLMVATSITTASLAKCFNGQSKHIIYPEM